jgi:hypothetical protein
VTEVRRVAGQLGGDDDLLLIDDELGVVALQRLEAMRAHRPRAVGRVHQAGRHEHRLVRLDHPRRHPPRTVGSDASPAPRVIGGVRGAVGVELFLEALARLKQPVRSVLGDRPALALALGVQRAAPLPHPGPTALRSGNELARVELERHRSLALSRFLELLVALAGQALLGLAQRLMPTLAGAQLLGQLVPAPVAIELVLARVDLGRLGEDLPRELTDTPQPATRCAPGWCAREVRARAGSAMPVPGLAEREQILDRRDASSPPARGRNGLML